MAKEIVETPLMKQYIEMKGKHPDAILLFRVGDFYETFSDDAIAASAATPDMMLEQTAAVFTKSFYVQLGADTDAIQNRYIFSTGAKMLGLAILLTACAIGAGFCLARIGAGVGRDLRHAVFERVTHFNNAEMDQFSTASLIS